MFLSNKLNLYICPGLPGHWRQACNGQAFMPHAVAMEHTIRTSSFAKVRLMMINIVINQRHHQHLHRTIHRQQTCICKDYKLAFFIFFTVLNDYYYYYYYYYSYLIHILRRLFNPYCCYYSHHYCYYYYIIIIKM